MSDSPASAAMIVHQVAFTFREDTTPEQRSAVLSAMHEFGTHARSLEGVVEFMLGNDAGLRPGNADWAVFARFDSAAGFERYASDEVHQNLISNVITPVTATRTAIQYEVN